MPAIDRSLFACRYNDVKIGSTKVVQDSCYPDWREKFIIPARRDEMNELRVEVCFIYINGDSSIENENSSMIFQQKMKVFSIEKR